MEVEKMAPVKERSRRIIWIADWCAVTGFLEHEPYLRRLVDSAYQKISDYFLSPRISVGVVDAPAVTGGPCLVLAVGIPGERGDAAQRLDRFVREWLRDALRRTRGKLCMVLLPGTTTQPEFDNRLIVGVQRAQGLGYALAASA
jgi:hypothetical protein